MTPIWEQIPLASSLEPRRFLFPAHLGASLVIAAGSSVWIRQIVTRRSVTTVLLYALPLVAVVYLLTFDAIPLAARIAPDPMRDQEQEMARALKPAGVTGRMFWNTGPSFAPYYFGSRDAEVSTVGGLPRVDLTARKGFIDTALGYLADYNVRSVFSDEGSFSGLTNAVADLGWVESARWGTRVLLTSPEPTSIFMNQTKDVGLIGGAGQPYWSLILPNSIRINNPDSMPEDLLATFKVIVMSAYSTGNVEENERILSNYVNNGGRVIFEEPNLSGNNLFGASHTIEDVPLEFALPGKDGPVDVKPFTADSGPFRGFSYNSVGEITLAGTTPDGEVVPLIQKKTLGEGAIYWVCCNIGNHIDGQEDHDMAKAIHWYFNNEIGGFRSLWPTNFDADITQTGPSTYDISYTADEPAPILISLDTLNHRNLTIEDGTAVRLTTVAPIGAAILPAGSHTVTLATQASPVSMSGAIVWLTGLLFAATILSAGWRPFSTGQGSYLAVMYYSARAARENAMRFFSPVWAGEMQILGGVIKADTPQIKKNFEAVSSARGSLERFGHEDEAGTIGVVFVEILAAEDESVAFSVDDLRLAMDDGEMFSPSVSSGTGVDASPQYILTTNLGRPRFRLEGEIVLEPGESVSGYVLFELSGNSGVRSLLIESSEIGGIDFAGADDSMGRSSRDI